MSDIKPDYIQAAIDDGELVYVDDEYDDDPDSPTYGLYVKVYHATTGMA